MALRFIDSFDDRSSVNFPYKWGGSMGTAYPALSTVYGRHDQGMYISNDGNIRPYLTLDIAQNIWFLGYAFKVPNVAITDHLFLVFWDMSFNAIQLFIYLRPTGAMQVYRGDSTLLLTTSPSFTPNAWQFFEFKYKIANAAGELEIRRNTVSVGAASGGGLDTQQTANAFCTSMEIRGGGNGQYIDDLYLCDGSGGDNYRGDCTVECLLPNGVGAHAAFTPSAGANWQNVDDPNTSAPCPDGDTTYNESSVPGNIDTFPYSNLVNSGTIKGVQVALNARKVNAKVRQAAPVIRQNGNDHVGTTVGMGDDYYSYPEIFETNPETLAAWTLADINTLAEFGYKDIA